MEWRRKVQLPLEKVQLLSEKQQRNVWRVRGHPRAPYLVCTTPTGPGHNYGFVVWVFGDFDFCGVFVGVLGYNETKVQLLLGVTFPLNSLLE